MATTKSNEPALRERILAVLASSSEPMSVSKIGVLLGLKRGGRVRVHLKSLTERGAILSEGTPKRPLWRIAEKGLEDVTMNQPESRPRVTTITAKMVDAMAAKQQPWKAKELAAEIGIDHLDVRNELVELEQLGVVYRTGRTRGTRWHLG